MQRVRRATLIIRAATPNIDEAIARLNAVAADAGVDLVDDESADVDIAVCLGGDGTILRALARFLGTSVPVIGANFGTVGFLAAIPAAELEVGMRRVFAGEYAVQSLPTLEVQVDGERYAAVNDAVIVSGTPGRIVELDYFIGGEDLGTQPCDGLLCATPPGSTAYNLSNGGPVLVWGLDAAVITFVAPHTLHARPLVVAPDFDLRVVNRSLGVEAVVLVDGHSVAALAQDDEVTVRFGTSRTLLATLPEQTFFGRYAQVFGID
jgi:NAD+ kinase